MAVDPPRTGRLTAVAFDVDGTLVDSERDGHRVAFNEAFADAGLAYRWDVETYGSLLAITGGRRRLCSYLAAQGCGPDEATDLAVRLHRTKTERFRAMVTAGRIPLRPGVRRLVEELHGAGVRLFVATTGSREWVEPLLSHHFGGSTFELCVTGSESTRLKPDPEVYQEILRCSGLAPADVVAVEDSANGLTAAKAAGLRCLLVTNDYTADEDASRADLVVDAFGPPAHRVAGRSLPLPNDSVTRETLVAIASAPE